MKVWKNFLKEIPSSFRRSLSQFKPIILLGGAGSVSHRWSSNTRTGDDSQSSSFGTPKIRTYKYTWVPVLLSKNFPNLLNNNTKQARTALQKLWKKLFRKNPPSVVIVVGNASSDNDT